MLASQLRLNHMKSVLSTIDIIHVIKSTRLSPPIFQWGSKVIRLIMHTRRGDPVDEAIYYMSQCSSTIMPQGKYTHQTLYSFSVSV